jgi:hypothetical protein
MTLSGDLKGRTTTEALVEKSEDEQIAFSRYMLAP